MVSAQVPGDDAKHGEAGKLGGPTWSQGEQYAGYGHHLHSSSSPLLKSIRPASIFACQDHDGSLLIGFLMSLTELIFSK